MNTLSEGGMRQRQVDFCISTVYFTIAGTKNQIIKILLMNVSHCCAEFWHR